MNKYIWCIPAFLLGMFIPLFIIKKTITPEESWAMNQPKEVQWAKARFDLMHQAADQLFFDDQNKGITIVRPTSDTQSPTGAIMWPK